MSEYKFWVIQELESWKQTWDIEYPEHMEDDNEKMVEGYNYIQSLIEKLSKDNCTKEDYEDILFQLWQKNASF